MSGRRDGAALYLRLSREDGDKEVSESISNQRNLLTAYAQEQGLGVWDIYTDDGYSGLNFDRPAFARMIADIEAGRVDTVITKDLSRLGRDYILTGHYIERFFPSHNVRYIAVGDNVDSEQGLHDLIPIRSVFNDYYARDISRKVKTALLSQKKHGAFIGSVPPYGYRKDPENKHRLLTDEETAPHVRRIFRAFLSGTGILSIANQLTQEGIPTPSGSKQLAATQRRFPGLWNDRTIRRILENPVYIGHMAQNKTEKKSYKLKQRTTLPPEQWIIVENTHEPIIRPEDFRAAGEMLAVRRYDNRRRNPDRAEHLLTGLVFCGDCGSPMATVREAATRYYLVCRTWRRHAALCASHCVREDAVIGAVGALLRSLAERWIDAEALTGGCACLLAPSAEAGFGPPNLPDPPDPLGPLGPLEKRLSETRRIRLELYKDKARGVVSEEEYRAFSGALAQEEAAIAAQLDAARRQSRPREDREALRDAVTALLSFEPLDRKALLFLVGRIEVGKDKEIAVTFHFSDPQSAID